MLDLSYLTVSASLFRKESHCADMIIPKEMIKIRMYHTLSRMKDKTVVNKKTQVNFDPLYPDETDTVPAAKRVY